MSSIKWVMKYLSPYWFGWTWASLLTIVAAFMNIVTPYIGGLMVDRVITGGEMNLLIPLLAIMVIATFIRMLLRYVFQIQFEQISQNILYKIREDLYVKLQELDFTYFNTTRVGDIMARMTGDTDAIRHAVAWTYFNILDNVILFVSALIFLAAFEWRLTLALLTVTPFIAVLTIFLSRKANQAFYHIRESFSRLNSMVEEHIGGNKVVKAFAREEFEIEKFNVRNEDFRKRNLESAEISSVYLPIIETFAGFMSVISIGLGGLFVLQGTMTIGNLVTFNGLIWMLNIPMRNVGNHVNDIQNYNASTYKIRQMLATEPKIPVSSQKTVDSLRGEIEFQHVSFAFADDPDTEVLRDINFKVEAGQTLGVLGETGSGKSTLVNLISRFFDPTEGRVLLDGMDVKEINVIDLRQNVAIVMQDVFLFSDTIRENISYGTPGARFEAVQRVAQVADASQFIERMPQQYDTYLGERGSGLSGGQKQRLSLARGLIKDPSILILDDTTSAVDMETEVKIQEGLQKSSERKTTIIIANRISSVKNSDKILILSKGAIIEQGTHEELLARGGAYAHIYEEQLGQADVEEGDQDESGLH
ncbi:ABC transporter ATP-binding protein [Jeotgalibaca ciconiae]|uniref:ABC transporter ATP-binding protein n=1 Tax=Jeotgalibaca ciconiae TaxID=2496265 RepID=A0A3Q9BJP9_9LACT|nr:ABC transporter ATP-binding protein [Jeotgalibaca ciconiae]AZP03936.1 ABC transporter ATP-binding protein [Jeotgalibaca ciconiae]